MKITETSGSCCSCSSTSGGKTCGCAENSSRPPTIKTTTGMITFSDRLDHLLARLGWRRSEHRVEPGLYRLGDPDADSPVFASANYSLSFDALRSPLAGIDAWILVLDTKGINVWCAAGKGTFGTDELVRRIESSDL
ncbi:MAG: carbon monoxide dehydrogenase, partial [Methanocorpusculum sp.]|nr:carbon monoxide dehydrogenase [Methanocorpusculum sp.]